MPTLWSSTAITMDMFEKSIVVLYEHPVRFEPSVVSFDVFHLIQSHVGERYSPSSEVMGSEMREREIAC